MSAHEHEMFLHALHSAADSIEPRSDGLDQIRARLRPRPYPLPVAWLAAAWMRLTLRLPENAFSPWRLAYSAPGQVAVKLRSVSERFRSVPEPTSGTLRSISAWFLSELPEPAAATRELASPRHGACSARSPPSGSPCSSSPSARTWRSRSRPHLSTSSGQTGQQGSGGGWLVESAATA